MGWYPHLRLLTGDGALRCSRCRDEPPRASHHALKRGFTVVFRRAIAVEQIARELLRGCELVIPYATSDSATSFATMSLDGVPAAMEQVGPRNVAHPIRAELTVGLHPIVPARHFEV